MSDTTIYAKQCGRYAWDIYTTYEYGGVIFEQYRGRILQLARSEYQAFHTAFDLRSEYEMQQPMLVAHGELAASMRDAIKTICGG